MKKDIKSLSVTLAFILMAGCGSSDNSVTKIRTLGETSVTDKKVVISDQTYTKNQEGTNFTFFKDIKKGDKLGTIKSKKFDGEVINMWLCGEYSDIFSISENGDLILNEDLDEDVKEIELTIKATIKKDGSCSEAQDKLNIKLDEKPPVATEPTNLSFYPFLDTTGLFLTEDKKYAITYAYGYSGDNIKIYELSDLKNPKEIVNLRESMDTRIYFVPTLSKDKSIMFFSAYDDYEGKGSYFNSVMDISDPKNPKKIGEFNSGEKKYYNDIIMSDDKNIAYLRFYNKSYYFDVFDISNPSNPIFIKSSSEAPEKLASDTIHKIYNLNENNDYKNINYLKGFALSKDKNTLYVASSSHENNIYKSKIRVIDVSDKNNPKTTVEYALDNIDFDAISLSNDETKLFVSYVHDTRKGESSGGAITLDLRNPNKLNEIDNFKIKLLDSGWMFVNDFVDMDDGRVTVVIHHEIS